MTQQWMPPIYRDGEAVAILDQNGLGGGGTTIRGQDDLYVFRLRVSCHGGSNALQDRHELWNIPSNSMKVNDYGGFD